MLPRKGTIFRCSFCSCVSLIVITIWILSPDLTRTAEEIELLRLNAMNRSDLQLEIDRLIEQTKEDLPDANVSVPLHDNITANEMSKIIMSLRREAPVNSHNFKYLINPMNMCAGQNVFLITYVHSNPIHFKLRMFIRETWGNRKYFPNHRVVFLMGMPSSSVLQESLYYEGHQYHDLIQEDFIDTYRNLTYKAIMGLKWISRHCNHAKFVLKSDDDIFINIFNLYNHLHSLSKQKMDLKKLLLCHVWYRMKVVRDPKSKWYVSRAEFRDNYFPPYCSGSAFVMTPDTVDVMYRESLKTPFFWVDDFYITGMLAQRLKLRHRRFNTVYVLIPNLFVERFTGHNWWSLVFGHVHNMNHMYIVWQRILTDRGIS